jgi:hypothetical protein
MCCGTKFLIILVLVLWFYLCTLYKYSLIGHYQQTTFPCINLTYVSFYIVFINYCQLFCMGVKLGR